MQNTTFWNANSSPTAVRTIERMAETMSVDKHALHVLFNTQWDMDGRVARWVQDPDIPESDRKRAESEGLLHPPKVYTHDEAVSEAIAHARSTDREAVARAFIASLANRRLDIRSALGSLAHAHLLPRHESTDPAGCDRCSAPETRKVDINHYLFRRLMWAGNILHGRPSYAAIDLAAFESDYTDGWEEGVPLFKAILAAIRRLPEAAGLIELRNAIGQEFPTNKVESTVLVEILGYAGILIPRDAQSMHATWVPHDEHCQPSHFYARDWRAPVNAWRGRDGINDEAIDFWFGWID